MVGIGEAWVPVSPENTQGRVLKHKASHVQRSFPLSLSAQPQEAASSTHAARMGGRPAKRGSRVGTDGRSLGNGNIVSVGRGGGDTRKCSESGFRRGLGTPTFTAAWFPKVTVWKPPEGPWLGVQVNSRRLSPSGMSLVLNKEGSSPQASVGDMKPRDISQPQTDEC